MAVDETLLDASSDPLVLRLYAWDPPGLSLGYFQKAPEGIAERAARAGYVVTRRLTGGGAILHAREVTYALVTDRPTGGNRTLYHMANRAIIAALAELGVSASQRGTTAADEGTFLCFGRHADFDIVVGEVKIAGSAQRMRGGRVLQHGSIICAPPPTFEGYDCEAALPRLDSGELVRHLVRGFEAVWGPEAGERNLTRAEKARAGSLVTDKYGLDGWIYSR
jgi:lipoate-protein ligase A